MNKPEYLYHYTSQEALLAILRSGELWATHVQYMNDRSEMVLGLDQLLAAIARREPSELSEEKQRRLRILEGLASRPVTSLGKVRPAYYSQLDVFVGSFSAHADSLDQWRAYADRGRGFALGFSWDSLKRAADTAGFHLESCRYSSEDQADAASDFVDSLLADLPGAAPRVHPALALAAAWAGTLKNSAFRGEDEWRLVSKFKLEDEGRVAHRAGRYTLIPYYRFPLPRKSNAIAASRIVVGPTQQRPHGVAAIRSLLGTIGAGDCEVLESAVPFRDSL